jgi:hypothetical protein
MLRWRQRRNAIYGVSQRQLLYCATGNHFDAARLAWYGRANVLAAGAHETRAATRQFPR